MSGKQSRKNKGVDRRNFLGLGAGAAGLYCSLKVGDAKNLTAKEVKKVDAAAASLTRPKRKEARDTVDTYTFQTPTPQPGGVTREYWVQATSVMWNPIPSGHDSWMNMDVPTARYRAYVYQLMTPGFASPLAPASIPGPTLEAEVGDVLKVHFRNADKNFFQAVTMHPHGVRYNPEYDGAYYGDFTRAGGFVAPGEEFTYTWEATPDSVGAWPYHDHGPNHVLNMARGLYGSIIIRPKGAKKPDREYFLHLSSLFPSISGLDSMVHTINGRSFAGNTPVLRSKVGEQVAIHVFGMNSDFHTFHIHGHRWLDSGGKVTVDSPAVGPSETVSVRFREDNPGRWIYHCHVSEHQEAGMAGWYLVER